MVAVLAGCLVALAVLGLGFYVVHRMPPGSFRVRTSLLRVFSFSIEIESSGAAGKSSGGVEQGRGLTDSGGEASGLAVPEAPLRE